MKDKIEKIGNSFDEDISSVDSSSKLEELRLKYLGKKGLISDAMADFRLIPNEIKKEMGSLINNLKNKIEETINAVKEKITKKEIMAKLEKEEPYDFSVPSDIKVGSLHPRTILQKQIEDIFVSMGFVIEDGPEVETEYNNFDAVNVPASHPARDIQDTFWLENGEVLKTQTSASQNRILKKYGPKCKVLFPGRCFRNEALDNCHENTFFQIEGVVVDENVSVANLIYFMKQMLKGVFKKDINVRLRPGYFPFTEPSFELDASCPFCGGKGCPTCGGSGWIELCPCGMIHPNVLRMGGIDPDKYNGFAFGLGFDRLVMIRTGLKDIRALTSGNVQILKQFGTKM